MRSNLSEDSNTRLLKAWEAGLKENSSNPLVKNKLNQKDKNLFYQFSEHYKNLSSLSRKVRRAMQRKWKHSLAGIALILALGGSPAFGATTINVNSGNVAALRQAIIDANSEAGDFVGLDTIILDGSTFNLPDGPYSFNGDNGLPVIETEIIIEGNGSTIQRVAGEDPPFFRIFAIDGDSENGNLTLRNTTVSGGFAVDSGGSVFDNRGGGILNFEGTLTIEDNSIIADNNAEDNGGGILNGGLGAELTVTNSTISGNTSDESGGGIYISGEATITNSTISGNDADVGGGIANDGTSNIYSSTISGNTADNDGGGIINFNVLEISNSTISGNYADVGGGVYNSNGSFETFNVTLTDNEATTNGGGVYNDDTALFQNSIVSGNSSPIAAEIYNNSSTDANYNNLFGHAGLTDAEAFNDFSPTVPTDINATQDGSNIPLNNILDTNLANNGGPTETHALVSGSPAINSADNTICADINTVNNVDQRGITRPQNVTCDRGAFEFIDLNNNSLDDCSESGMPPEIVDGACVLAAPGIASAPTMSQWGMIAFGLIAGLFGLRFLRKKGLGIRD